MNRQEKNRSALGRFHMPRFELLEMRLPPGNVMLGGSGVTWLDHNQSDADFGLTVRLAEKGRTSFIWTSDRTVPNVLFQKGRVQVLMEARPQPLTFEHDRSALAELGRLDVNDHLGDPLLENMVTAIVGARKSTVRSKAPSQAMQQSIRTNDVAAMPVSALNIRVSLGSAVKTSGSQSADVFADYALPREAVNEAQRDRIAERLGQIPLRFEENVGQFDDRVDFTARAGGYTLFLTPTAAVFSIKAPAQQVGKLGNETPSLDSEMEHHGSQSAGVAVYMEIVGGNPNARPTGVDRLPGITNYFIGNESAEWHTNIFSHARVEYDDVYPGIDLVYYSKDGQLEYDFVVAPGADPRSINLRFDGADGVEVNPQGDLLVHSTAGDVVQKKPYLYQDTGVSRREVAGNFIVNSGNQHQSPDLITFQVGEHDSGLPLIIDPVVGLVYSTLLGGSSHDDLNDVALDSSGNGYVVGNTESADFPLTPGAFDTAFVGDSEGFVTKLDPTGSNLVFATYLGGLDDDSISSVVLDGGGNVYLSGSTFSSDFPTTPNALDNTKNGSYDAFITKLHPNGTALVYSTYLGGSRSEGTHDMAVDSNGHAYVTGYTDGLFPTTPGAFDTTHGGAGCGGWCADAFVAKLNSAGSALLFSTYLGGSNIDSGLALVVDSSGNSYVTGITESSNFPTTPGAYDTTQGGRKDVFITKLNPLGSGVAFSTYLGGYHDDWGTEIVVDPHGDVYVTGWTWTSNFPTTAGAFDTTFNGGSGDLFVSKLTPGGDALIFSTFLGGSGGDQLADFSIDGLGRAFVTGSTSSPNIPTTSNALDKTLGGLSDAYLAILSSSGASLMYGTFLGGSSSDAGGEISMHANGTFVVGGATGSADFPTTPGAFDTSHNSVGNGGDAFVTKFKATVGLAKAPATAYPLIP